MKFSRNTESGRMEAYTDDGVFVGHVVTMGDMISGPKSAQDGGPGSGNFNHKGRPGQVGGSGPGGGTSGKKSEKSSGQIEIDPDFDVFEFMESEAEKYEKKGPEFQKKVEQAIHSLKEKRLSNSIARAAKECGGNMWRFNEMLTPDARKALEEQYSAIDTEETWPDYFKRIQMTLASDPQYSENASGPVDGIDISTSFSWNNEPYTEKKFGQLIDTEIEAVIDRQGFNGTPKVVSDEEFEKIVGENPGWPVMFRTFSAPSKELADQYDKDLTSGAWYVDCSVGGAKYGQGMYTAYAPELHVIPYDSQYIDTSEEGFADQIIKGKDGKLWKYDDANRYLMWSRIPEGGAMFGTEAFSGKGEIFIVKEKGRTVVDSDGDELPFSELYGYNGLVAIKPATEEDTKRPDYSRPLGQMKEYIRMNEERERHYGIYGNAKQDGHYRPVGTEVPDVHTMLTGEAGSRRFTPDRSKPIRLENESTKLKDGKYILDIKVKYSTQQDESMMAAVGEVKNGEFRFLGDDHRNWKIDNFFKKSRYEPSPYKEITAYPAEEVDTSVDPTTITRKMTLDKSARIIRYKDLERDFKMDYPSKFKNIGSFATAKGYDAIVCDNYGKTIVVLNRTKVIFSEKHVEVPREGAS